MGNAFTKYLKGTAKKLDPVKAAKKAAKKSIKVAKKLDPVKAAQKLAKQTKKSQKGSEVSRAYAAANPRTELASPRLRRKQATSVRRRAAAVQRDSAPNQWRKGAKRR